MSERQINRRIVCGDGAGYNQGLPMTAGAIADELAYLAEEFRYEPLDPERDLPIEIRFHRLGDAR